MDRGLGLRERARKKWQKNKQTIFARAEYRKCKLQQVFGGKRIIAQQDGKL